MARFDIQITWPARQDLAQLLAFSVQTWGGEQADSYELEFVDALDNIRNYPELGLARPDAFPSCRVHPVGSHVIFYRVLGTTIEVVRILHQRQDFSGQFDDLD